MNLGHPEELTFWQAPGQRRQNSQYDYKPRDLCFPLDRSYLQKTTQGREKPCSRYSKGAT